MFLQRLLVTLVLLPLGLVAIHLGGIVFTSLVALLICAAAWEFAHLFKHIGFQPSTTLLIAGTGGLIVGRLFNAFDSAPLIITLTIFIAMAIHLFAYERGRDQAGTDFAITISGAFYLGWLGAYLISLRELPDGKWWLLVALPSVWLADSGAYVFGRSFGRRKLSPRLSPKKTWEGYFGGILVGTLSGAGLAALFQSLAWSSPEITPFAGAVLGFLLSVITTLGDLGESMIKRQAGLKDSGKLLPGHGGAFDRIDSWLWAGPIAYYAILWFFLP